MMKILFISITIITVTITLIVIVNKLLTHLIYYQLCPLNFPLVLLILSLILICLQLPLPLLQLPRLRLSLEKLDGDLMQVFVTGLIKRSVPNSLRPVEKCILKITPLFNNNKLSSANETDLTHSQLLDSIDCVSINYSLKGYNKGGDH